ncbi:hypothetical protein ASPZODRAFT_132640 [Penicilliopsis zonata CBS 506.65]|uniref:DUF7137 domain-containing protein n=1 Tax=Penicilliopsis zonata CBS 506.65 TaxID=1073090 RepID=A0A1L9SH86_9EURO|nr:hypothetical protein ASPZODRAFT_132640 [Penicilliopsis zonata CBS 506.65]OJJ46572.1 hypothetical protein ASPZODRAFT_132640 [Penicilliopsis zonata CBS 506.65]
MRGLPLLFILLLATLSAAWPWRPYGLTHGEVVNKRADKSTSSTTTEATTGAAASSTTTATETGTSSGGTSASTSTSTGTDTSTTTATKSDTKTTTGTDTGTSTGTSSGNTTTSSIPADAAAGGISMMTPSAGSTTYYRIGEYVTFAWNYTSLSVTPSAVNVVASCSLNDQIYTISGNMSVGPTGRVTWDTNNYKGSATAPLLTATYTLIIYDASKSISDTASPGYLSAASTTFAMYTAQPYTPLNEYLCVTCSGAFSEMERNALKFAAGMFTITVLSFTWFVGGTRMLTL